MRPTPCMGNMCGYYVVRVLHRWGLAFYDFYYVLIYFLDNLVLVYVYLCVYHIAQ